MNAVTMTTATGDRPAQYDLVLDHLLKGKALNQVEAIFEFGIMRLAAVIHRIRRNGYEVKADKVNVTSNRGLVHCVAQYRIEYTQTIMRF